MKWISFISLNVRGNAVSFISFWTHFNHFNQRRGNVLRMLPQGNPPGTLISFICFCVFHFLLDAGALISFISFLSFMFFHFLQGAGTHISFISFGFFIWYWVRGPLFLSFLSFLLGFFIWYWVWGSLFLSFLSFLLIFSFDTGCGDPYFFHFFHFFHFFFIFHLILGCGEPYFFHFFNSFGFFIWYWGAGTHISFISSISLVSRFYLCYRYAGTHSFSFPSFLLCFSFLWALLHRTWHLCEVDHMVLTSL